MAAAWGGEIDEPVAQVRPENWLIRSVRLERISGPRSFVRNDESS